VVERLEGTNVLSEVSRRVLDSARFMCGHFEQMPRGSFGVASQDILAGVNGGRVEDGK
jgi:hypothetical protein